jgi:predicted phage tail protein
MRVIRVYGRLAKFLGRRVFRAEVASAAEAMRFLVANFPQIEGHMNDQRYRVKLGPRAIGEDELQEPAGAQEISIVPVIGGAGAVGRIIAGVALIAGAFIIGQPWLGAFAFTIITGIGASLALGGVAQLLTPVPRFDAGGNAGGNAGGKQGQTDEAKDPRKTYSFSGIQNNTRLGLSAALIYGRRVVGSNIVSQEIDVVQVLG